MATSRFGRCRARGLFARRAARHLAEQLITFGADLRQIRGGCATATSGDDVTGCLCPRRSVRTWADTSLAFGPEPIHLDPAANLDAVLSQLARDGADVAVVAFQQIAQLLASRLVLR